jgi:hypothetical protein
MNEGDERAPQTHVAHELAEFLVQATEGEALRWAIDARILALSQAGAEHIDLSRDTAKDDG